MELERMSEYAKQCSKYSNAYFVKQERDCINCINSDETVWSTCSIPEIKWKQQRFKLAQVIQQKRLELSLITNKNALKKD